MNGNSFCCLIFYVCFISQERIFRWEQESRPKFSVLPWKCGTIYKAYTTSCIKQLQPVGLVYKFDGINRITKARRTKEIRDFNTLFLLKAVRYFTTEHFNKISYLHVSSTHGLVIILLRPSSVTSAVFPSISLVVFLLSSSCRCSWGSISALLVSYQSPQSQLNCKASNTNSDRTQDQFLSQHLRLAFCSAFSARQTTQTKTPTRVFQLIY